MAPGFSPSRLGGAQGAIEIDEPTTERMGVHISKVLCYHLLHEESASRKHRGGAWQVSIRLRVAGHPTTEAGQNMVCIEAIKWTKHYTVRLTKLQDERRTARAQHTIHFTQRRR